MSDFGWTRHIAWEQDGDGIWEVDFLTKRPAPPPGSDGGVGEFKRERRAAEVAQGCDVERAERPCESYAIIKEGMG